MKIEGLTETMFSHAVALAQNGRMKSTIHCGGNDVFILNMDSTILLKYKSPQTFENAFSFFANDYESPKIRIEAGKVIFVTNAKGLKRVKTCPAPKVTFNEIKKMYDGFHPEKSQGITFTKEMIGLLADGLSHVEIKKEGGPVILLQKDIYSGSKIEVSKNKSGNSLLDVEEDIVDFGPIGIRTVDFKALFTFSDTLTWYVQKDQPWVCIEDKTGQMSAILATCLYDELGIIEEISGGK